MDELGGLENALDHVAQLVEVDSRSDLNVVQFPKPKTPLEQVLKLLGAQVQMGQGVALQKRALDTVAPALEALNVLEKPQNYSTYEPLKIQ